MVPFISFEGIDGSGKTTQIRLLENHLVSRDIRVLVAREPGGTEAGEAIRQILLQSKTKKLRPMSELLLYYASRHQNLYQTILPALDAGYWVLCDRYADASMAYQGYGRGLELLVIEQLNKFAIHQRMPDLTILIDIDPALGLSRARQRNSLGSADEGRFEKESLEFFDRVRRGYLQIAERNPTRIRVVHGGKSVENIHRQVCDLVSPLMQLGSKNP